MKIKINPFLYSFYLPRSLICASCGIHLNLEHVARLVIDLLWFEKLWPNRMPIISGRMCNIKVSRWFGGSSGPEDHKRTRVKSQLNSNLPSSVPVPLQL